MRNHAILLLLLGIAACSAQTATRIPPPPVIPIPGEALAGSTIAVYPLNNLRVDTVMGWDRDFADRRQALDKVDSIVVAALYRRLPQITWVPPADLRKAAAKAPGMLTEPDLMALSLMQTHALDRIPDPLAAQLRQLTGVATGGRYALVPANLWFERMSATHGRAKLVVALADVRRGAVSWSATVTGVGETPWEAINSAALQLTAQDAPQ